MTDSNDHSRIEQQLELGGEPPAPAPPPPVDVQNGRAFEWQVGQDRYERWLNSCAPSASARRTVAAASPTISPSA